MDQPKYSWQTPYLDALMKLDPVQRILKVSEAERAIGLRLFQRPDVEELQALRVALADLWFLIERYKPVKIPHVA